MINERKEDMNLKKKLKAFFTFKRRRDGGFTLVELIVVIAILAILAGVGTAGYSGYIKNAGKNTDKSTVGSILRATETGSYLFPMDDPLQIGDVGLSLPLGFVVLTDEVIFQYKCDNFYAPQAEGAIAWNDAQLNINWSIPSQDVILSPKDAINLPLSQVDLSDFNML